ncbi:hypothetical protein QBC36DRAFT_390510 [Triangularia setosa]|uniref:Rhodopsin domain-containing protein n=1 Tax=Triangularia setosa TaxID=2587417 RepID=A0AAN6VZJ1_9PEZI|nr:hypothetical protein QBC36DRAFT_390510 [Podospora setosa]
MLTTSDRTVEFISTLSAMTALAFCGLFLRFFCKIKHGKPVMLDDYLMGVSWSLTLASLCLLLKSVLDYGYTLHQDHRGHFEQGAATLIAIAQGLTSTSGATAKTSIALTLWRVSPFPWHKFVLKLTTAITILSTIVTAVVISIKIHDSDMERECIENSHVWRFGVFYAGKFAPTGILGIMKLSYINCLSVLSVDLSYTSIDLITYHFVEPTVIIAAASLPALRFFLRETTRNHHRRSGRASELLNFTNPSPGTRRSFFFPGLSTRGNRLSDPLLDSTSTVSLSAMFHTGLPTPSGEQAVALAPVRSTPVSGVGLGVGTGGGREGVTTVTTITGRPLPASTSAAELPGNGQIVKTTRVVVVSSGSQPTTGQGGREVVRFLAAKEEGVALGG